MLVTILGPGDTVLNNASQIPAFHGGACTLMDSQAAEEIHCGQR